MPQSRWFQCDFLRHTSWSQNILIYVSYVLWAHDPDISDGTMLILWRGWQQKESANEQLEEENRCTHEFQATYYL